jgi:SAM-dependent MidA family methyltransferase
LQRHRAGLFDRLEYWILEPSARRRVLQENSLKQFKATVKWGADFEELRSVSCPQQASRKAPFVRGVIFSNELLDALPVHRLGWDAAARRWFEWGVLLDAGRFRWARLPLSETRLVDHQLMALAPALADGFTIERCPLATEWWRAAASSLLCGKLLAVDYGLAADERFLPGRPQGTVRAFYRHHASADLLARPGEQDLTAHVDFTELTRAGESGGLTTEQFVTQEKFLTEIARRFWSDSATADNWMPDQRRQFQTLTHPEHLGRAFRVLVQSRI